MKDKLIITSGGMDSTTLLFDRKDEIKKAISFYYGQKHHKELDYARRNCERLGIDWSLIDLGILLPHLKSNLLQDGGAIPEGRYDDETQKLTVVPFRNGIMLSIACGIAASNGCKAILIGNHAGDHAIYPDCRDTFIRPMSEAMKMGTYEEVVIDAPYTYLNKGDIGRIGAQLGIDYGRDSWSCYKGGDVHCGKCGACTERKEALAGFDTTVYES